MNRTAAELLAELLANGKVVMLTSLESAALAMMAYTRGLKIVIIPAGQYDNAYLD